MVKWKIVTTRRRLKVGDDRGLILPLALLVTVILGILAAAILSIGGSEAQIASNHLRAIQADFLAEAGLEHAFNWLLADTGRMTNPTPISGQLATGNYNALYQAAGTNTVRVVSTGTTIGGAQQIRRAIMSTFFHSDNAIRTNGPLTIQGSTEVEGTTELNGQCGSVHTNSNLELNGSKVTITGSATANGAYTVTGSPSVGPGSGGAKPKETIPAINPTDFLNTAMATLSADHLFQMKANGQVLDGSGGQIADLADPDFGDTYCGWKYTAGPSAEWEVRSGSGTPCNGTFYFEGNATVTSSPGSTSTPWKTTIIATGDVIVSGNPTIGADAAYTVQDTLFVAGRDAKISGTPSNAYNGLIAAHEQFAISGTPTINGFIIGEDKSAISSTVTSNTVSGNPTINYNCGLNPPLQSPLQILSWGL